ncbi:MAG: exodeoxyribonuclease VII large subunit [Candidatus Saccharimonadales bacterium]|nr:exodeoxyribonuclease VII large subunit [Candidatus Saccharibacteria bacterium]
MVTGDRQMVNPAFSVSDFVVALNQTLEFAYSYVEVQGELSNFRVSKNKWVYFDLKDETASLKCFTTVYALPGPLEDGMVVRVAGSPRLHPLYNFSFQVQSIVPIGEGALRRAADLLAAKLEAEGLFDASRKRPLPYPPRRIALITAGDSAAYADFMKISNARWGGLHIVHYNVLVQGEQAPGEIVAALKRVNESDAAPDVVVMVRGGGSADDLAAWSDERVVRAVAGSRVPTLVAIGHEIDVSLAELAADSRASTPSNAAELLLPDRKEELRHLRAYLRRLDEQLMVSITRRRTGLVMLTERLDEELRQVAQLARQRLTTAQSLLAAYDPVRPLSQGYAFVQASSGKTVTRAAQLQEGNEIEVKFIDGKVVSQVKTVHTNEE